MLPLLNIVLNIPELLLEVVQTLDRLRDLLFLTLELIDRPWDQPKHFGTIHGLISVIHALEFGLGHLDLL